MTPEREQLLEHLFEFASTEYRLEAPQPRGGNRIRASLGRFGSIDLRFQPEEAVEQPALFGCKGDKIKMQVGYFVGHISFRGKRAYTVARAAMLAMARKAAHPGTHLLGLGAKKANGNLTVSLAALRLSGPTKKG